MSLPLSELIKVSISLTPSINQSAGFGIPLFITEANAKYKTDEVIRTYGNLDEVMEDWATSTEAYKFASTIFSQEDKVSRLMIALSKPKLSAPIIISQPAGVKISGVVGDPVELSMEVFSPSVVLSYQWFIGDEEIVGQNTPTLSTTIVEEWNGLEIYCMVTSASPLYEFKSVTTMIEVL